MTVLVMFAINDSIIFAGDLTETMEDGKTYDGIRKTFELTNELPAGVMFNGKADFEDLSMETLIGLFKKNTDFKKLGSIENVKKEFINFISKTTKYTSVNEYLNEVIERFKDELNTKISQSTFEKVIETKKREDVYSYLKDYPNYEDEFFDIIPDGKDKRKYNQILWEIFCHDLYFEGTGVVFGGFDMTHNHPSYFEINLHCNDNGRIIYDEIDSRVNLEKPLIKIFAMNEEAYTFITGVNYKFQEHVDEYIRASNKQIIKKIQSYLENNNIENVNKIVGECEKIIDDSYSDLNEEIDNFRIDALEDTSYSIEYLPRNLLCIFADYLIQLTGLKQKISSDIESVSMKSDIGVMTKVYGFKWFKYDDSRV